MANIKPVTKPRRSERVALSWPAQWWVEGLPEHPCELLDVTEFGAFVACPDRDAKEVHEGDVVSVQITVDDEQYMVEGHARWIGVSPAHHKMGFGVAFDANSVYVCEAMAFALLQAKESEQRAS